MNEVVVKSGQVMDVLGRKCEVRDTDARIVFVDAITEDRVNYGTVCLSLGALTVDGENDPVMHVHTRLRMNAVSAQILHATLGNLIAQLQAPPDKMQTN